MRPSPVRRRIDRRNDVRPRPENKRPTARTNRRRRNCPSAEGNPERDANRQHPPGRYSGSTEGPGATTCQATETSNGACGGVQLASRSNSPVYASPPPMAPARPRRRSWKFFSSRTRRSQMRRRSCRPRRSPRRITPLLESPITLRRLWQRPLTLIMLNRTRVPVRCHAGKSKSHPERTLAAAASRQPLPEPSDDDAPAAARPPVRSTGPRSGDVTEEWQALRARLSFRELDKTPHASSSCSATSISCSITFSDPPILGLTEELANSGSSGSVSIGTTSAEMRPDREFGDVHPEAALTL